MSISSDQSDCELMSDTNTLMTERGEINTRKSEQQLLVPPPSGKGCGLQCRYILAVISFLGFVNIYCLRVNLSVAIVAMVNSTGHVAHNNDSECAVPNVTLSPISGGEFNWSPSQQGIILGSFFYGYICTQIIGGSLAQRYGGKWIFGCGVLATAVLTLLTPVAARQGYGVLIGLRVLEGFFEGATFPAMHAIWSVWAPTLERTKLIAFTYGGAHFGTVVSLPLSALLADSGFLGGWPSVFYVFGAIGCVWFIFWCFLAYDSPATHPRITLEERVYIQKAIGPLKKKVSIPWRAVFTSMPMWAIIVVHFCCNWGFYTMLTTLPTYLNDILHFNIKQNGFLSAVPYLGLFLSMTGCGLLTDYIRSRKYVSTKNCRKILIFVGMTVPSIFLVSIGYSGCNVPLSLTLVVLSVGTLGISFPGYIVNHVDIASQYAGLSLSSVFLVSIGYSGCSVPLSLSLVTLAVGTVGIAWPAFCVNHIDIAPQYAGTLMGITNTVATIPGFVGPEVVGLLTNEHQTRRQWQYVFIIAACINMFGVVFFAIFADGETQSWAKLHKEELSDNEEESVYSSEDHPQDLSHAESHWTQSQPP